MCGMCTNGEKWSTEYGPLRETDFGLNKDLKAATMSMFQRLKGTMFKRKKEWLIKMVSSPSWLSP